MNTLFERVKKSVFPAFLVVVLFGIPSFAQCGGNGCGNGGTAPYAGRTGGSIDTPG